MKYQVEGATGFQDLKIYDGITYNSYRDACNARGLLKDDAEWLQCLQDAAIYQMPKEFRLLFATIIRENSPSSPLTLFQAMKFDLASDFRNQRDNLNGPFIDSDFNEALWEIEGILRRQPPCTR